MTNFHVEFLMTVDPKDSFCNSISSFNNLIQTLDSVSLSSGTIQYRLQKFGYDVQTGEISSDRQRFFHLKLTCGNERQLAEFEDLLRMIRTVLYKASNKPAQVLWDDTSFYYSHKAYPLIHDIENTMRKSITKFMLINVGLGWTNEAIPQEVAESLRGKSQSGGQNYLYEVDFIQLSNFLFREYTTANTKNLVERLRKAKDVQDLDLVDLQGLIPRSNWERYFSNVVDCESEYLRIRWTKLYERRNQVAHNKPLSRTEFDEIETSVNELKPKLQKALDSLEQIDVSDVEREEVAENVASTKDTRYLDFLQLWNVLLAGLFELAMLGASKQEEKDHISQHLHFNLRGLLNVITKDHQTLPRHFKVEVLDVYKYRNLIVHESDVALTDEAMLKLTSDLQGLIEKVRQSFREIKTAQVSERAVGK